MRNIFRTILIELIWLTLSLAISFLASLFLFGQDLISGSVDLQLYDTYFVFSSFWAVFPLFLNIAFLVFLVKEGRKKFNRTFPNLIILALGLSLVILFSRAANEFTKLRVNFSALPGKSQPPTLEDPFVAITTNACMVLQLAVTLTLVLVGFYWGKQRR